MGTCCCWTISWYHEGIGMSDNIASHNGSCFVKFLIFYHDFVFSTLTGRCLYVLRLALVICLALHYFHLPPLLLGLIIGNFSLELVALVYTHYYVKRVQGSFPWNHEFWQTEDSNRVVMVVQFLGTARYQGQCNQEWRRGIRSPRRLKSRMLKQGMAV